MSKKRKEPVGFRSDSGRYLDIALLIRTLRTTPNTWRLVFPAAPHATYKALRTGRHVDLKALTDGAIEAEFRNEYLAEGHRRGDVYARWVPREEQ